MRMTSAAIENFFMAMSSNRYLSNDNRIKLTLEMPINMYNNRGEREAAVTGLFMAICS